MVWREKGWFWNKARTVVVQYMYGTYVQEVKQNSTKKNAHLVVIKGIFVTLEGLKSNPHVKLLVMLPINGLGVTTRYPKLNNNNNNK